MKKSLVLLLQFAFRVFFLIVCLRRCVARGKGILQSHHLIDELIESVKEDEAMQKLRDSPFFKVLESAQEKFLYLDMIRKYNILVPAF